MNKHTLQGLADEMILETECEAVVVSYDPNYRAIETSVFWEASCDYKSESKLNDGIAEIAIQQSIAFMDRHTPESLTVYACRWDDTHLKNTQESDLQWKIVTFEDISVGLLTVEE